MTIGGSTSDDLHGFGLPARQAVVAAHDEAQALGNERVGTEHLLLGLLADDDLIGVLLDAGATLAATRRKVREAVPGAAPALRSAPLPRSARCARALGRAPRFARDQRADMVGTGHLLLAVLDVEGTAGQVLRGIGVDIEQLRSAISSMGTAGQDDQPKAAADVPTAATPRCQGCGNDLAAGVASSLVPVEGGTGRGALLMSCPACGDVLGALPF